jgi:hypothetical protein
VGTAVKKAVWISFDLGIQGDYPSLYAWLDSHGAKECGDSLAFLNYEYEEPLSISQRGDRLRECLKADLKKALKVNPRTTRIYVVYRDAGTTKMKGAFLFGGRRDAPWSGYSAKGEGAVDEEEI